MCTERRVSRDVPDVLVSVADNLVEQMNTLYQLNWTRLYARDIGLLNYVIWIDKETYFLRGLPARDQHLPFVLKMIKVCAGPPAMYARVERQKSGSPLTKLGWDTSTHLVQASPREIGAELLCIIRKRTIVLIILTKQSG